MMGFLNRKATTALLAVGIGSAVVVVSVAFLSIKIMHKRGKRVTKNDGDEEISRLDKIRKKKQDEREISLILLRNEYPKIKTEEFDYVLSLSLEKLQDKLFKRELTAEKVMRVFISKALNVHEEFNCITEFIPGAMDKAKELDKMHMVKGSLHGIPFCVKDDTAVKGMDSTLGCTTNLYKPSKESAVIVQSLEILGAIPFCITNIPQTCYSFGSGNPIFGLTLNPLNKKLAPGGSSSGTACLVSAGGASFGTGSDTGGSLRNPAHFSGISTLKATSNRLSRRGCQKCCQNFPVPGVLAKRAEDVALIFQALTENNLQNRLDGKAVPIPWNAPVFDSKERLRIGYIKSFPPIIPLGDTQDVIMKAKAYLESTGHILIPFTMPFEPSRCFEIPGDPNLYKRLDKLLRFDQVYEGLNPVYQKENHKEQESLKSDTGYVDFLSTKESLIDSLLDEMKLQAVDLLLCPVFPFPALAVDDSAAFYDAVLYTMIWNILDFPAGVVKVWRESGMKWKSSINDQPSLSPYLKDAALKSEEDVKGMPIGVQLVGKPFQEELVLRTIVELDEINDP